MSIGWVLAVQEKAGPRWRANAIDFHVAFLVLKHFPSNPKLPVTFWGQEVVAWEVVKMLPSTQSVKYFGHEAQAMYACIHETGGGFFARMCAHPVIANASVKTHPHRLSVREWLYAGTVSDDSHCGESLFTAPISCAWQ
jgi:hypothetical protein